MQEKLFSYGTLQQADVQLRLFGKTVTSNADSLLGYRVQTIKITDAAFLSGGESAIQKTLIYTGNSNDQLQGELLHVSKEELHIVDQYEPAGYKREKVMLQSGSEAWVYLANPE